MDSVGQQMSDEMIGRFEFLPDFIAASMLVTMILMLIATCVLLLFLIFWVWSLVHCMRNENLESNERTTWILLIIFTNWLGSLIYFFARPKSRKQPVSAPMVALSMSDIKRMEENPFFPSNNLKK